MKSFLLEFLKQLEQEIPIPNKGHHAIHFGRYGSDGTGWSDQLCLTINLSGIDRGFQTLFLNDDDFAETPADIAKNVKLIINSIQKG